MCTIKKVHQIPRRDLRGRLLFVQAASHGGESILAILFVALDGIRFGTYANKDHE